MGLTNISIILIGLFLFPIFMFGYIIYIANKRKSTTEFVIRVITFFAFTVLLFMLYYVGLSYEGGTNKPIDIFLSLTLAIKILFLQYEAQSIPVAMNNAYFVVAYFIGSISASLYVLFNVIALFSHLFMNALKVMFYSRSKVIYVLGDIEKIDIFMTSLEKKSGFKTTFFSLFSFYKTKIIIVLPPELKDAHNLRKYQVNYAFIYRKLNGQVVEFLINLKSTYEQTIISLFDNDDLNTIILNSFYEEVVNNYVRFEDVHEEEFEIFLKMKADNPKYAKIEEKIRNFKKSHLKINAYIPFNELDTLDIYDLHKNLKHTVNFYSYNQITSYELVFNQPVVTKDKINHHFFMIGFGLTNRKILKDLLINNVIPGIKTTYTVISNDADNSKEHFYQDINYLNLNFDDGDYLEKPNIDNLFKNVVFETCDVTKVDFYNLLDSSIDSNDSHTFIISVGEDIFNIQTTNILNKYLKRRDFLNTPKVLLRIKDSELNISRVFDESKLIINTFGQYDEVYSYDQIINKEYLNLAKNLYLALRGEDSKLIDNSWNSLPYYDQHSSLYAVLSTRNKLRLLGFDIKEFGTDVEMSKFYEVYDPKNKINENHPVKSVEDLEQYFTSSIRNEIAWYEHERWNAYMIMNGYVPMKVSILKERIKKREQKLEKDELKKQHICITTYKGLKDYALIIDDYNREFDTNYNYDFLKYDYSHMDELERILKESKYKLVLIEEENKNND